MIPWQQRFELSLRYVFPFAIALGLMLLACLPSLFGSRHVLAPHFALICVYYWSVYHPRALPYWAVFVLGLLQDALYGLPIGFTSISLMLLRYLITLQRRLFAQEAFLPLWLVFFVLSFLVFAAEWCTMGLYQHQLFPLEDTLMHWLLTAAVYPLLHTMLNAVYATLVPSRHA